jgi:glycosyltransferase involved in cell wall biosynthesis
MVQNMKMSIAIPFHGAREHWTLKTVLNTHNISYVKEIVITMEPCDRDYSDFYAKLKLYPKVKVYTNKKNLFVFRNKINAVSKCTGDWVALIDSDNVINNQFLGVFKNIINKNENCIYAPSIGYPVLNYTKFIGMDIGMRRAISLLDNPQFNMLMNTMNYIIHRKTWLKALESSMKDSYDPLTADSTFINYQCWKAGMVMNVIEGMMYTHTIHSNKAAENIQSTYILYHEQGSIENDKIIKLMRNYYENDAGSLVVPADTVGKVSKAPVDLSATGGPSRVLVCPERSENRPDLLTD